jgi:succinyl-CoA synthetase beta subunit
MRLLEHQSRKLLSEYGVAFTDSIVVTTAEAAAAAAQTLGAAVMVKAQVPFGGRAKAGAVRSAETPAAAAHQAAELLGMDLRGVIVDTVSVEVKISFTRELYAAVAWDSTDKLPVALFTIAGGIDVEQSDEPCARKTFDPRTGLSVADSREMAIEMGLDGDVRDAAASLLIQLATAFLETDAVLIEINPLVEQADATLLGLDAHVEIEDDAMFRQAARLTPLGKLISTSAGRPPTLLEQEAARIDAMDHRGVAGRVVEFDGDLALLIGGGGASLTVFDAILDYGGKPANYCEIGGNPTPEKVAALTELLLSKPAVTSLAVIMNVVNNTRADDIATGVLAGVRQAGREPARIISLFRVPGNREQETHDVLRAAGVPFCGREVSLDQCARRAVSHVT